MQAVFSIEEQRNIRKTLQEDIRNREEDSLEDWKSGEYNNNKKCVICTDYAFPRSQTSLQKAPGRTRTGDLRITNASLYQLSHGSA